jgi:hypothetical protein
MAAAPRVVVHLRAQLDRKRLGLIFGSGASKDLLFPDWDELVQQIAKHKHIRCEHLLAKFKSVKPPKGQRRSRPIVEKSLSSITQVIFGVFRDKYLRRESLDAPLTFLQEQQIRSTWLRIMHDILYRKVDSDADIRKNTIMDHPYLPSFLGLIKNSPMTVN